MSTSERAGELGMGELGTTVLYEVSDGVATLTLHRPHRKNAWTFDMERDLFQGLPRLRIRVVDYADTEASPLAARRRMAVAVP